MKSLNFRPAEPQTENQEKYLRSIKKNAITICTGFAGTGKTYLALSTALELITKQSQKFTKLIIIRPYMSSNTGEKLGALPGHLDEKVGPYVASIIDNLTELKMPPRDIAQLINSNLIEYTVLSMCRGRNFNHCIVMVEEAQNVPIAGQAMKMLLTRVGKNCKMIISGDLDQLDIDYNNSGLIEIVEKLYNIDGIGIIEMNEVQDIQRSPLVAQILERLT